MLNLAMPSVCLGPRAEGGRAVRDAAADGVDVDCVPDGGGGGLPRRRRAAVHGGHRHRELDAGRDALLLRMCKYQSFFPC